MADIKCTHCNLTFDENVMIVEKDGDETCYFCCHGCQGVYHLLKDEGLDTFYAKLGKNTLTPPKESEKEELEKYDYEGFQNRYTKLREDGLREINLVIEGIHCSACVWLNEKVLRKTDGVIEADINYTTNKAKVVWDDSALKLSKIIETIRSIGYNAFPYDPKLQEEYATKKRKDYYMRILAAVFGLTNIMWMAVAQYAGYFTGIEQKYKDILNIFEFLLATLVLFYSGWVFFRGAYYGFRNRMVNMDTLVASGALLTYLYSIYAMVTKNGEVYFESVVMIITFVLVGKYLEVLGKKQAVDTLDLLKSTIPTEVIKLQNSGEKVICAVENINIGDILEIKAGEKVVIDGKIVEGSGYFDESSLSGESIPILKKEGDLVLSGSVCSDALIRYEATKDSSSSLLASIVTLLEDSITKKPKIEQIANSISGYFSIIILLIAIVTFIGWLYFTQDVQRALIVSISVIVIACPCALGLATPMATLVGIGVAARRGILFKEATFLETMAKSTLVALDKTGTVTEGKPSVITADISKDIDPKLIYSLVSTSTHPISLGVKNYLESQFEDIQTVTIKDAKNIQGRGISGIHGNKKVYGGNEAYMQELGIAITKKPLNSLFFIADDSKLLATFELKDQLKEGAKETIANLKKLGLKIVMLTGDHDQSAQAIAQEAGITEYHAELLPQDKAAFIDELKSKGEIVTMVGDGINDSIALSKSNIAIAMGGGADVAIGVSDVVLIDESVKKIEDAFRISRRSYRAIKENISFSIIYNIIAVPMAIMGYVYPLVAALSMSLSSLVVVGNSIRIKRLRFKEKN